MLHPQSARCARPVAVPREVAGEPQCRGSGMQIELHPRARHTDGQGSTGDNEAEQSDQPGPQTEAAGPAGQCRKSRLQRMQPLDLSAFSAFHSAIAFAPNIGGQFLNRAGDRRPLLEGTHGSTLAVRRHQGPGRFCNRPLDVVRPGRTGGNIERHFLACRRGRARARYRVSGMLPHMVDPVPGRRRTARPSIKPPMETLEVDRRAKHHPWVAVPAVLEAWPPSHTQYGT